MPPWPASLNKILKYIMLFSITLCNHGSKRAYHDRQWARPSICAFKEGGHETNKYEHLTRYRYLAIGKGSLMRSARDLQVHVAKASWRSIAWVPYTLAKLAISLYPSLWLLVPGLSSQYLPLFPIQPALNVSNISENAATRFCKLREVFSITSYILCFY